MLLCLRACGLLHAACVQPCVVAACVPPWALALPCLRWLPVYLEVTQKPHGGSPARPLAQSSPRVHASRPDREALNPGGQQLIDDDLYTHCTVPAAGCWGSLKPRRPSRRTLTPAYTLHPRLATRASPWPPAAVVLFGVVTTIGEPVYSLVHTNTVGAPLLLLAPFLLHPSSSLRWRRRGFTPWREAIHTVS